jgi:proteasome lid subunit RPN8/RPN11
MTDTSQALPLAALTIPVTILRQMQEVALASYPGECCGLLFGPHDGDQATRVVPMDNIQDRLHALDPVTHPRTSRDGFQMNALAASRQIDAADANGERLIAIFHSHVDCEPTFSDEDRVMAAPPPAGVPLHPDSWHVILACWPDGIGDVRAYRWNGDDFAPYALSTDAPRAGSGDGETN